LKFLGGGSARLIICMLLRAQIVKLLGPSEVVSQEIDSSVPILLSGNWAFRMSPQFKGALLVGSWCQKVRRAAEKRNFLDCPGKHYSSFLFMKRSRPFSRAGEWIPHVWLKNVRGAQIFTKLYERHRRSQWPRDLRNGSAASRLLGLWVRIPPGTWMSVCCECCVLSGRGLCVVVVARPEESYRVWCVWVWS